MAMTIYTPEMKKNIQDSLKKMNEDIKKAKGQIKDRKYKEAAQTVVDIMDAKHDRVATNFPDIEPKAGVTLPFFAVFDVFEELDRKARRIIDLLALNKKASDADLDSYIAEMKALIEELQRELLDKLQLGDAIGAEFIKAIIGVMDELIAQAKGAKGSNGTWDAQAQEDALTRLHKYKDDYWKCFPSAFALDKAYDILFLIDEALWFCLPYLQSRDRIDSATIDRFNDQLDNAEHLKKHLEEMIEKSVAKAP